MSFVIRQTVPFTTDGSGDATVYSEVVTGGVYTIRYVYVDAATGADFTITAEATGQPIVTITNAGTSSTQWQPRQAKHDSVGAAIASHYEMVAVADERIKIVVAQGGATKTGTFEILVV
jgi:hypothetical protein